MSRSLRIMEMALKAPTDNTTEFTSVSLDAGDCRTGAGGNNEVSSSSNVHDTSEPNLSDDGIGPSQLGNRTDTCFTGSTLESEYPCKITDPTECDNSVIIIDSNIQNEENEELVQSFTVDDVHTLDIDDIPLIFLTNPTDEDQNKVSTPLSDLNNDISSLDVDDVGKDPDFIQAETSSSDTEPEDQETHESHNDTIDSISKRNGRKRRRNESEWKSNIRKKARAAGQEYMSSKKTRIRARGLRQACKSTCKHRCTEVFTEEERENILHAFWNEEVDYDRKRQFVASCIEEVPIQRHRSRTGMREGQRKVTYIYSLSKNGRQRVCKAFFLSTLDISQNFVDNALRKILSGGIIKGHKKGHIPHNKISDEVRDEIRSHILKFPVYESHYSREKTSRKYLECDLNITKMYQLYYDERVAANVPTDEIGKMWLYREIFNTEFNLSFKQPSADTCDTCDTFVIKLKEHLDDSERQLMQSQFDKHVSEAKSRYTLKAGDKEASRKDTTKKVVMVDLEKCLATPLLRNAQSFYSLKLWSFNLTIHDATDNKTYCMMWDETISGRGGNEIASSIIKWLTEINLNPQIKELTIWSDNCPSQNRNIMMVMCYFYILSICPNLLVVNHKYLLRGHTHQEADSDHALIERQLKKTPAFRICTPWDWQQLVRITSSKFTVIDMNVTDFLNMKHLYTDNRALFIKPRKAESGSILRLSDAVHLQVRREKPGYLFYKTDFSQTSFEEANFNRRTNTEKNSVMKIPPIRTEEKPISTKKYNHLMKLLQWLPTRFHSFYNNLKHENSTAEESDA